MTLLEQAVFDKRQQLAQATRALGQHDRHFVILGEGNTSLRIDDASFLVKASGYAFADASEDSFVHVYREPVEALLAHSDRVDEQALQDCYAAAKVDTRDPRRPSVETIFHAGLLSLPGVNAVAHTHPTAVNALSCANSWPQCCEGRLFPDEAVICGPASLLVDYMDPGVELGRSIMRGAHAFYKTHGVVPKCIIMRNHGLIACGADLAECDRITEMAVKAAYIRLGSLQAGGIHSLATETTDHLLQRPDERYRQQLFAEKGM